MKKGKHPIVTFDDGSKREFPSISDVRKELGLNAGTVSYNLKRNVHECKAYAKKGVRSIVWAEGYFSTSNATKCDKGVKRGPRKPKEEVVEQAVPA